MKPKLVIKFTVKSKGLTLQKGTSQHAYLSQVKPHCCALEFYDCTSYLLSSFSAIFCYYQQITISVIHSNSILLPTNIKPPSHHTSQNSSKIILKSISLFIVNRLQMEVCTISKGQDFQSIGSKIYFGYPFWNWTLFQIGKVLYQVKYYYYCCYIKMREVCTRDILATPKRKHKTI